MLYTEEIEFGNQPKVFFNHLKLYYTTSYVWLQYNVLIHCCTYIYSLKSCCEGFKSGTGKMYFSMEINVRENWSKGNQEMTIQGCNVET